jgi:hypothetical protein
MDRTEPVLSRQVTSGILFVIAITGFVGCSKSIGREELSGTYLLAYDYGTERLSIHPDGSYTQEFAEPGGQFRTINTGRWELGRGDSWDGDVIKLFDPIVVDDGFGHRSDFARFAGQWNMRVRKSWRGRLRFLVNDDLGYAFEPVK